MCQSFIICDSIDFLIFQKHFFPTHFFYFSLFSRFFFTILSLICAAIKYLKWVSDTFLRVFPGENCSSTSRYITSILCHFAMSHRNSWVCGFVYWWRSNFFSLVPQIFFFSFFIGSTEIFSFVFCRIFF